MDYDFRNRLNPNNNNSSSSMMYGRPSQQQPSHNPMYGPASSLYPKIGGGGGHPVNPPPPRPNTSSSSAGGGMGIRVTLKPEFRITPPPQMSPHIGEIPRSTFQFDFELERKILAEAEKETPNWSKLLESLPQRTARPISRVNSSVDPVVGKYMAAGLNREAVPIAVAKYGDDPTKVREFVNGFSVLREMGFEANSVAEALFTHNNDKEAAAHYLSVSS
ncbi:ubiquitin-associated/translation elongation factor EF1B protein [Artemisia annua]|uniref:Ubiquitin-associated/translation elongation factor EF1B protein n=1 Tax=Artemisia annua TaxID=35608 RepID=A0A2U1LG39_ARTAN|nr:ubiquitin-associated/translation elongation factor EF1B protein [Artemisia annua]